MQENPKLEGAENQPNQDVEPEGGTTPDVEVGTLAHQTYPAFGDRSVITPSVTNAVVTDRENNFFRTLNLADSGDALFQTAAFRPDNVPKRTDRTMFDPTVPLEQQRHLFPPRQGPNHPDYVADPRPLDQRPELFDDGMGPKHPKFIPGLPLELQMHTLSPDYPVDPGQLGDNLSKLEKGDGAALSKVVRDFMKYARGEMRTEQDYINGVRAMETLNYLRDQGINMDFNIKDGTIKMTLPGSTEITMDRNGLTHPRGERQNFMNNLADHLKDNLAEDRPAECTDLLPRIERGDPEALKEITRVLTSPNAFLGGPAVERAMAALNHLAQRGINIGIENGSIVFSMNHGPGQNSELRVGRDGTFSLQGQEFNRFMERFKARATLGGSRDNCRT